MKLGEKLLSKECSMDNPFLIGEEPYLLGITLPFTVVAESNIILISMDASQFFRILHTATGTAIKNMRDQS